MPVLLLTEEDVRQLLTMEMALEAVEEGLRKYALDEGQNVPEVAKQLDVLANTLHKAIRAGRLRQPQKKANAPGLK